MVGKLVSASVRTLVSRLQADVGRKRAGGHRVERKKMMVPGGLWGVET